MLIWSCLLVPFPFLRYCIQRFKDNQRDIWFFYCPFNCLSRLTIELVRTQMNTNNTPSPESTEWFIEGQASSPILLLVHPLPLSRQKGRPATHRKTEKERQLAHGRGGKGVGEEPNHSTARKPGPLQIIQYSLPINLHKSWYEKEVL